jgi:NADPH:quinone reductase-like Zn-dependent oxidoreductase
MALGLLQKLRLHPGQRVLVVGASGGIGPAIVQLAKRHFGAIVTGVCGPARLAYVKSLGADAVVDYTQEDFVNRPDTYDVLIDILGKSPFARCRPARSCSRLPLRSIQGCCTLACPACS